MHQIIYSCLLSSGLCFQAQAAPSLKDKFPKVAKEWQIQSLKLGGGSYWQGYRGHSVDFQGKKLEGYWDRRDENFEIKRVKASRSLSSVDAQAVVKSLSQLQKALVDESECEIAADGPENYLRLAYKDAQGSTEELFIVSEESRIFRCGDLYVTDASYAQLAESLETLLPEPEEESLAKQGLPR